MDFRGLGGQDAQPLVSAIVLCYNQGKFVTEGLESIRKQTFKNIQLIIIDDASKDDSVSLIKRWIKDNGIKCTFIAHENNRGICKSTNEALSYAKGKYIAMLDSDDVWMPHKIEDQVGLMEELGSEIGVIYSDALIIDEEGKITRESCIEWHKDVCKLDKIPEGNIFLDLLTADFAVPVTTLIRKECYEKVGPYDENLVFGDWDMWIRISRHYKFIFLPSITSKYRVLSYSYFRRLNSSLKCDYYATLITMYNKYFHYEEIGERGLSIIKKMLVQYANLIYESNCAKRNRYLFLALRCLRDVHSLIRFASSILGLNHRDYLKVISTLSYLKRRLGVQKIEQI